MKRYMILITVLVLSNITFGGLLSPTAVHARYYGDDYRYDRGYYPRYSPHYRHYNPVVRRDYHSSEGYAPDGTYHEEDTVVDRHSSYYSRGRNEAITRPRTTVKSWSEQPGQETTREKTTWIGADGRPHSTTITRDTTEDQWGNTHTETHVDLRKVKP
ncbi:MAG: hypothetical protein ACD_75C00093G0002 [uncultured bacterium]|nr:MAG: hypothetical protein ACD_75C00093G0002 [uncultured bacterium]